MSMENHSSSFYPMEASAREIALGVLSREGSRLRQIVPEGIWPEFEELLAGAVHDGIEFGEGIATFLNQDPSKLEHYFEGYLNGIEDTTTRKQGE